MGAFLVAHAGTEDDLIDDWRLAETLVVQKAEGIRAHVHLAERIGALGLAGDVAGMEIEGRRDQARRADARETALSSLPPRLDLALLLAATLACSANTMVGRPR